MKIEKLNDRQIRCTLNKKDLEDRELRLSELAYGSEKAKSLFREMMQQAYNDFGFEAEDIPLMIEAIPLSTDCLVLVVTKVDNPEELDTRFSKFTSGVRPDDCSDYDDESDYEISKEDTLSDSLEPDSINNIAKESLMNCFGQISDLIEKVAKQTGKSFIPLNAAISASPVKDNSKDSNIIKHDKSSEASTSQRNTPDYRMYRFDSLEQIAKACRYINPYFNAHSAVYKINDRSTYLLLLYCNTDDATFNRLCGILSEFGTLERSTYATIAYLEEHMDLIIDNDAVATMAQL